MFFQYFQEILGSHWERLGAAFGNALGSPLGGLGDAMGGLGDALWTPWTSKLRHGTPRLHQERRRGSNSVVWEHPVGWQPA